ncbi:1-acyl-sn-glycerol-3-phosphate acyltransferase [Ferruginibacter lapsinanis]|uniref:1-acyl-sn-glycerol-3-phosphate acyltransferase n=1 Tax=Ferruginibacter lapsinanis TaxID=563172 RepID=UPI001E48AA8A|nr:1-acyl-sn-glycerol-3-phosphate acyltransferase [Ferruginibacter lapsinanis]UEG50305.1 1-acyl-sn-glycerol-3-phosphate acyltransferase [Ferruginibacter lapsinanis]
MLFALLKIPARIAIRLYCRNIQINHKELLSIEGPVMIAANHPNSFLDAIIINTIFKRPVYSLARGDAFANKFYTKVLRSLKMLPVYRISEGAENLEHNYKTFDACKDIFKKNGIVLIFSEGRCVNEWHLRPLKKGTARLAFSSWENNIPLKILPLGINYNSFHRFGKNVKLNFGKIIKQKDYGEITSSFGKNIAAFNADLEKQLQQLVIELDKKDKVLIDHTFSVPVSATKKIWLSIPAVLGYILHWPLYIPVEKIAAKTTKHNGHYDSVVVSLLFVLYPVYLLLISFIIYQFTCGYWWLTTFLLLPFFAWSYVQLKK